MREYLGSDGETIFGMEMNLRHSLIVIGAIVTLVCAAFGMFSLSTNAESRSNDNPETTEVVVKLNAAASSMIDDINGTYQTTTIEILVGSAGIYRLRVPTTSSAADLAEEMADDLRLVYAEPNYSSEAPEGNPRYIGSWGGPSVTDFEAPYAIDMLGLTSAHLYNRGNGETIAILDTGFQLDHPDLVNVWTTSRYDFIDDDSNPTDVTDGDDNDGDGFADEAYGHGTHIAGIVTLVAPEAQIMPLRVLDADGRGNIFVVAEAIQFAIQNGASVINLSLGSAQESELLEDVLEDAVKVNDIVVIAAAGNLGNTLKQFPASEDEVVAVTAINEQNQKTDFANYGDWIDVAAPGEAILSAFPPSVQASWSGTSMAVPFVAGHAALIRSAVPSLSAVEVAGYIRSSAQSVDHQNPGFQEQLGSGRIDVGSSLQAICNSDGVCQDPDLSGQLILEVRGIVESRPASGNSGNWLIGGNDYIADENTEFRLEDGPLIVDGCADVEYRNTLPATALKIRSRSPNECSSSSTPTPSVRPTTSPTATPSHTSTVISVPTIPITPTPVETPSVSPTQSSTPDSTLTAVPTSDNSKPTITPQNTPNATDSPAPNPTLDRTSYLPVVVP